jgi:pimeloyl-ACP methyl ester carboxylesterase
MNATSDRIARSLAAPARALARGAQRALRHPLRLTRFHSRYAETRFGRLHYYDSDPGSQRPVAVFVHGLGGNGLTLVALAALVRRHRRVILPDMFHFAGLSEPSKASLDSHEHVASLADLVDRLGVDGVDMAGHSAGGGAAIWFAVRHPERTRTLALFNPGGFSFAFPAIKRRCLDYATGDLAARVFVERFGGNFVLGAPPVRAFCTTMLRHAVRQDGVCDYLHGVAPHHYVDAVVRDLRCPVLLLWGDDDRLLSSDTVTHVVRELDSVEAYWVRGASHLLPIANPRLVADRLASFWSAGQPRPSMLRALESRLFSPLPLVRVPPASRPPRADG